MFDAPGGPLLISADPKYLWHRLTARHGLTDPDPTLTGPARFAARSQVITDWVASFTERPTLIAALEHAGVAWAEIRTPATLTDSPTLKARDIVAHIDNRQGGTRPIIRMPYRFSAASCEPRAGAAHVGEHNTEILTSWLGMDEDRVAELRDSGALLSTPQPESAR